MRCGRHLKRFARALELPEDIMTDISRITMLGNRQLVVENHRGIVEYSPELVKINLGRAFLRIEGSEMVLGNLQYGQILLEGQIRMLHYDI